MFPILFQIGGVPIHSYGFFIALGFLVSLFTVRWLAIRSRLNAQKILDLTFFTFVMGWLGGRIFYILTHWSSYAQDWRGIFRIWEGGMVFFGGLIAAVPMALFLIWKWKLPAWKTADVMIGLIPTHILGRIGCFGAGCCYGKPTGTDFGVVFTESPMVDKYLLGVRLHPTQLYESGANLILFLALLWVFKRKKFDGQPALIYFLSYPVLRSIIEIYRGDLVRGYIIDDVLSTSQFISIFIILAALLILWFRLKTVTRSS